MERLVALGNRFDPVALHRLRRQARRLRYAAEVNDALIGQDSGAPAAFKELQERLGAIHDNHVLGDRLSRVAARAKAPGQAPLAAEARPSRSGSTSRAAAIIALFWSANRSRS